MALSNPSDALFFADCAVTCDEMPLTRSMHRFTANDMIQLELHNTVRFTVWEVPLNTHVSGDCQFWLNADTHHERANSSAHAHRIPLTPFHDAHWDLP